mmetsp:Transcript_28523/g.54433  ORF Transcript_28523/g.54433 Transcript_28523/m.54433 type:complete len:869 (+) Transcript_28523:113-2719(+)
MNSAAKSPCDGLKEEAMDANSDTLGEGYLFKFSRTLTGRQAWRKRYFVSTGAVLFCYKAKDTWDRRERPEKVFRVDCSDGYVEDTGMVRLHGREHYCLTLCHRSVTTGELKRLKLSSLRPEEAAHWKKIINNAREAALNLHQTGRTSSFVHTTSWEDSHHSSPSDILPISKIGQPRLSTGPLQEDPCPRSDNSTSSALVRGPCTGGSHNETTNSNSEVGPPTNLPTVHADFNRDSIGDLPSEKKRIVRQATRGIRPKELDLVAETVNKLRQVPNSEADLWRSVKAPTLLDDEDESDGSSAENNNEEPSNQSSVERKRLIKVENGLRFFQQVSLEGEEPISVPILESRGRVRAPPEAVFKLVMDLNRSRCEWDITFSRGRVVQSIDGHTDIIHYELRPLTVWPLWPQPYPRDFCLQRYWRRDDDGTYIILLRSHTHPDCPSQMSHVRANLVGGGFIISPHPSKEGGSDQDRPDSLVMQMIEMQPGGWMHPRFRFAHAMYHQILLATGAIREAFDQMTHETMEQLWEEHIQDIELDAFEERIGANMYTLDNSNSCMDSLEVGSIAAQMPSVKCTLSRHHDNVEEHTQDTEFPIPLPVEFASGSLAKTTSKVKRGIRLIPGKFGNMPQCEWPGKQPGNTDVWGYCDAPHTQFKVRSSRYLLTKQKQTAGIPQMQCVASDWFKSDKRMDNLSGRLGGTVMQHLLKDPHIAYVFAVNIQVPAQNQYSLVNYFACSEPVDPSSLLGRFINNEDDKFRNARFKLIPAVAKGPWVVQKSVGTTPLIVGGALKVDFYKGERYFEVDIDIGSSAVANSVVRFVLGYAKYICVDIAYLIQGNVESELPESLVAAVRVAHLNMDAARDPPSEEYLKSSHG